MANTKKASSIPVWRSIKSWRQKLNYPSKKAPSSGANKIGKYPCKKCDFVGAKPGQLGGHQKVHRSKAKLRKEALGGVRAANAKLKSNSSTKASVAEKVQKPKKYTPALRTVIKALSKPSRKPFRFSPATVEKYLSGSQKSALCAHWNTGKTYLQVAKKLRIVPAKVDAYWQLLDQRSAARNRAWGVTAPAKARATPVISWDMRPDVDKVEHLIKTAGLDAASTTGQGGTLSDSSRTTISRTHIESLIREHEYKVGQLKSVLSML